MFNVEQNLFLLSVVSDEGMQGVTVGHPANQAWVGGQGDHCVALNADECNTKPRQMQTNIQFIVKDSIIMCIYFMSSTVRVYKCVCSRYVWNVRYLGVCVCDCVSTWGSCARTQGRWPAVCWPDQTAAWLSHPASGPRGPSTGTWTRGHYCLQRAPQKHNIDTLLKKGLRALCKNHYMVGFGSTGCFLQGSPLLLCSCMSITFAWSNV